MAETWYLPKDRTEWQLEKVVALVRHLSPECGWMLEAKENRGTRSNKQNRFLWGVVYPTILSKGGETMAGWTTDDLHKFFLGEHYGWERREIFGQVTNVPVRRSKRLKTTEFSEHVEFIQMFMAQRGVFVPDPDPELAI